VRASLFKAGDPVTITVFALINKEGGGKGWFILNVRKGTTKKVKEFADAESLTVDEFTNERMNPSGKTGWSTCPFCGARVKSKNSHEHLTRAHPNRRSSEEA